MTPQNMLDSLKDLPTVAYTKYNSAHLTPNCLVCFFEGPQDSYYYEDRIKNVCGEYIEIECAGKQNVRKIHDWIHEEEKDNYRLTYFIDKDFDNPIGNADFFETNCYSIENYYCTLEVFKRLLTDYFGLDQVSDKQDYDRSISFYDQQMSDFHSIVQLFNNYYAAIKKIERNNKEEKYDIKCGNAFPTLLAKITIDKKNKEYDLDKLNLKYNSNIKETDLREQDAIIGKEPIRFYRGKYELSMMKMIVNSLISQTKIGSKIKRTDRIIQRTTPPLKVNKCVDERLFMKYLSEFAETPSHLNTYLNHFVLETWLGSK